MMQVTQFIFKHSMSIPLTKDKKTYTLKLGDYLDIQLGMNAYYSEKAGADVIDSWNSPVINLSLDSATTITQTCFCLLITLLYL